VLAALDPAPQLFARVNRLSFEQGTPDSKIVAGVDWSMPYTYGTWGISAKATRYGAVLEPGVSMGSEPDDLRDITLSPSWVLALSLTGSLLDDKLSVSIGADNLTDQYPERTPIARTNPNGGTVNLNPTNAVAFSRYAPYGFNGRFFYARASYHW
jgi:iron complex outermembrane recepter protein